MLPSLKLKALKKGQWEIVEDYFYEIPMNSVLVVRGAIPAGFICDLDSVPRLPVFYGWLKNRSVIAAVIHDWLCHIDVPKDIADKAFLIAMKMEGVRYRYRFPIYLGVKYFGKAYSGLSKI